MARMSKRPSLLFLCGTPSVEHVLSGAVTQSGLLVWLLLQVLGEALWIGKSKGSKQLVVVSTLRLRVDDELGEHTRHQMKHTLHICNGPKSTPLFVSMIVQNHVLDCIV